MIGRCVACRIVYEWTGRPRLSRARCPVHIGIALERTTRGSRQTIVKRSPAYVVVQDAKRARAHAAMRRERELEAADVIPADHPLAPHEDR